MAKSDGPFSTGPFSTPAPSTLEPTLDDLEGDIEGHWDNLIKRVAWTTVADEPDPSKKMEDTLLEMWGFVDRHKDKFTREMGPVDEDMLDHLEGHFRYLDERVGDALKHSDILALAEMVYIYDSVLPNLVMEKITPNFEGTTVKLLVVPPALYNWMFDLDLVWARIISNKRIDRALLKRLYEDRENFVKEAIEHSVFMPIPPRGDVDEVSGGLLRRKWFRNYDITPKELHEYAYRKVSEQMAHLL